MDLSEYADALAALQPGDAAEIELGSLSSRALKRRLGQAAKQTGYSLKWARDTGGGALRFQVRAARGATQPPGPRGRRPQARVATQQNSRGLSGGRAWRGAASGAV